jgi:hypothetical protein
MEPVTGSFLQPEFLEKIDLVLISEPNWKIIESKLNLTVSQFPSMLIIHKVDEGNKILKTYNTEH